MQNVKLFFPCHSEPAEESPSLTSKRHSSMGCFDFALTSLNTTQKSILQGDAITTLTLRSSMTQINAKCKMQNEIYDKIKNLKKGYKARLIAL